MVAVNGACASSASREAIRSEGSDHHFRLSHRTWGHACSIGMTWSARVLPVVQPKLPRKFGSSIMEAPSCGGSAWAGESGERLA